MHTAHRSFIFAVITQISNLDSKSNRGKRKRKKKRGSNFVANWKKKFGKTVGVSFNTINHLCWNILHNPSFSCLCCSFLPLTWYKMYIFLVLESHFYHVMTEVFRPQPVTAPFGLGKAAGFLPSSGALNVPVRTWLLLPSGLLGGDVDSFSTLSSTTRLRSQG